MRIQPWSANPCYWQYKGEPVLLLGGSCEDNLFQIPNLEGHLDEIAGVGGNYIRNTMSDRDEGNVYPYRRLDAGLYDLDQWCNEYWERFDALLRLTDERDIIVQIEIWDRFDLSDSKGMDNWQRHPYRPANNINYTREQTGLADGYPDHPGQDKHPFYHTVPGMPQYESRYDRLRVYQERYVAKLLSHSLPYGHVLYCMNNETSSDPGWGRHWIAFVKERSEQTGLSAYATDMFDDIWKAEDSEMLEVVLRDYETYDFVDISQVNSRNFGQQHWDRLHWITHRAREHPRPVNHTKIYSDGQTSFGSGTPQDGIERFWRNLLCGSASVRFHRPPAGIGLNSTARGCIRAARSVESMVRFWTLAPRMDLLRNRGENSAYLAADPGRTYVLFFPLGGSVGLSLADVSGSMRWTWIDVGSGESNSPVLTDAEETHTLVAPGESAWVVVGTKEDA